MNIINFKKPEGPEMYYASVVYKDDTREKYVVEGVQPEGDMLWMVHDDESLTLVSISNIKSVTVTPIKETQ